MLSREVNVLMIFFSYCLVLPLMEGSENPTADMSNLKLPLQNLASEVNAVGESSGNRFNLLRSLNKILTKAGPILMSASMTFSEITAFNPQNDSKEMELTKDNFDLVVNGLSRVENKMTDIENVVVHESSKNSYAGYQRNIENLYLDWEHATQSRLRGQEEVNRAFFIKQFDLHYKQAALNLFKAMTGHFDGELNNDLLHSAKKRYKCNGVKLRHMCAAVTQTINQGLCVEGAYYTYLTMKERANKEKEMWEKRMELLSKKCDAVLTECRDDWKKHVLPDMWDIYNKHKSENNGVVAQEVYKHLKENFPQRTWFVFVYNSVTGFEHHAYKSELDEIFNDVQTQWRVNKKMFSLVSIDLEKYPEFKNKEVAQERLNDIRNTISECKGDLVKKEEKSASLVLLKLAEDPKGESGLISYAVSLNLDLSFAGPPERIATAVIRVPPNCKVYQPLNFQLFIMG